MNTTSVLLAAAVFSAPAFAQGADECTGATTLTMGVADNFDTTAATLSATAWPCAGGGGPDLWWEYTTTNGAGFDITFSLCGSSYDTSLEVFSGSCGALVAEICNDDSCGLQSEIVLPSPAAGTTYFVRVGGFAGSTGGGAIIADEAMPPMPPDCTMPDMFEDNDDCPGAVAIGDGTYPDLNVEEFDQDYFAVTVADGATLTVDIFFENDFSDVDLYLWDPLVECDTNVATTGGAYLVRGFSASDDEQIIYTNATGLDQDLIIEIDMFSAGGCNSYEMVVDGAGMGTGGIGVPYCMANPNSTGVAAEILAMGSRQIADNNVTLVGSMVPASSFAFFIASQTQGFVPNAGGSSGNLCVGGSTGRYVGPGQIQQADANGEVMLGIDLTQMPQPTGFVAAAAGETWNFQLWFRDTDSMGNTTSNFTNGTGVTFL